MTIGASQCGALRTSRNSETSDPAKFPPTATSGAPAAITGLNTPPERRGTDPRLPRANCATFSNAFTASVHAPWLRPRSLCTEDTSIPGHLGTRESPQNFGKPPRSFPRPSRSARSTGRQLPAESLENGELEPIECPGFQAEFLGLLQ